MSLLNKVLGWFGLTKKVAPETFKTKPQEEFEEDDLDCTFLLGMKDNKIVMYVESRDDEEVNLGVLIAALLTGQLSKELAETCVEQLGHERALVVLESSKSYAQEVLKMQGGQPNNIVREAPVVLPSRAFQNDSQTPSL